MRRPVKIAFAIRVWLSGAFLSAAWLSSTSLAQEDSYQRVGERHMSLPSRPLLLQEEAEETASVRRPDFFLPLDEQALWLDVPQPDEIPLAKELIAQPHLLPANMVSPPAASSDLPIGLDDAGIRAALDPLRHTLHLSPAKLEGIVAAYASHGYQAFWFNRRGETINHLPGVEGVLRAIDAAEQDGLDGQRLRRAVPHLPQGHITPEQAITLDLSISLAAYLYAHDARGGRLEPSRLSALLTPLLRLPDAEGLLLRLAGQDAAQVEAVLRGYQPRHAGYIALRAQLAHIRSSTALSGDAVTRMASTDNTPTAPRKEELVADILVNMERWRWLPADLGEKHIFVNVPEYRLFLVDAGAVVHEARVIVGRSETPTPIFSDAMEHLIINPSWHVPPSILRKEFLPNLAKDPDYAVRKGFEVVRNGNSISIRQPPGERNALGQIKFIFPNQHSVYLHDTPGRQLFAQENRAFSHGCVRVEAPFALAQRILASQSGESEAALRAMVGKGERLIRINGTLPVHLAYFTLSVDENGELKRQKDIYGHDARMRTAFLQAGNTLGVTALLP